MVKCPLKKQHLKKYIADFGEYFITGVITPAQYCVFEISDLEKFPDDKYVILYSVVQKSLFLAKRSRPDLQTAVSFLCTRVRPPEIFD